MGGARHSAARGAPPAAAAAAAREPPPLRLLALHAFRSSASHARGRCAALQRRLRGVAELVFVDAPHELPSFATGGACPPATPRRAWLVTPEQWAQLQQQPGQQQQQQQLQLQQQQCRPPPAWATDPWQPERQTHGWSASAAACHHALRDLGPFDGLLGFSQGAAVAAVLAAQQWQQQQAQGQQQRPGGKPDPAPPFAFVLLCSGFRSPVPEHATLLAEAAAAGGIPLPSLHLFGSADRQIDAAASEALAACFHPAQASAASGGTAGCRCLLLIPHSGWRRSDACRHAPAPAPLQRCVVRHGAGHLIPSSREAVAPLRAFLEEQQRQRRQPEPG